MNSGHWRLDQVIRDIANGNIDALSIAATAVSDGDTHCCHEFESQNRAMKELVRLAKIGKKHDTKQVRKSSNKR